MNKIAPFALRNRNPDVLSCIASLSNDEIFTPPELANRILDCIADAWSKDNNGANLWSDKSVRFLDPCSKSGVFLREITRRLTSGLADAIPDLEQRVNHILTQQVYGIAITKLTSLLSRRSLYCSKFANSPHSVVKGFKSEHGNIWYEAIEHTWDNQRCTFCGANQSTYDRPAGSDSHAYAFIHASDFEKAITDTFGTNMQFDVIIGNPPYQLGSDGGTRDVPIYQLFVNQAKLLSPKYLAMVIPSRWMASGLGLSDFRRDMLTDRRIRSLVDFPAATDVFPGVEVKAGVCYFLWDKSHDGDCDVTTIRGAEIIGPTVRNLGEFDVFVRDYRAVSILRKVLLLNEPSLNERLARDKEFGWTSNFDGFLLKPKPQYVPIYFIRKMKRGIGYISRDAVHKSPDLIDKWKVLVPKAFNGGDSVPHQILGKTIVAPSPSVCTQSYLFFYVNSRAEAESLQSYYSTRFFRFLVSLRKITQDATHSTYKWVPSQSFDRTWTDEMLYLKYGLNESEIHYIESQVRILQSDETIEEPHED